MERRFMGHSPTENNPEWQTLKDHTEGVTWRLLTHVEHFDFEFAEPHAWWIGLLHDLGKYRTLWQKERLGWNPETGQAIKPGGGKVPHADAGTVFYAAQHAKSGTALHGVENSEVPFVILCHHSGLKNENNLHERSKGLEGGLPAVMQMMQGAHELDGLNALCPVRPTGLPSRSRAFYTRMLLSALVDADRLDTEGHGTPTNAKLRNRRRKEHTPMDELFDALERHMLQLNEQKK